MLILVPALALGATTIILMYEASDECKDLGLYEVLQDDEVSVFRMRRDYFKFVKNNVYVVVGEEWDQVFVDVAKPRLKIEEIMPEHYYSRAYTLDERYGPVVNLSMLDPSYIYLYFYYGNHEIFVLTRDVLEILSREEVYYVDELKEEIFWKLLEPTIGVKKLEEGIEKLVRSLGISRFFFNTRILFEHKRPYMAVVLYVDTMEPGGRGISSEELLRLGRAIRELRDYIRGVVILDQPFHPTDYFSIIRGIMDIERRTQSDLRKIIQSSVPCGLGDGFSPPDIYAIVIDYPCVVENYVKSPDELEIFVDTVLENILSLPEYGPILSKHRWLLHIDEPTPVTPYPLTSNLHNQTSLPEISSTCSFPRKHTLMIVGTLVTIPAVVIALFIAKHKTKTL